MGDILTHVLSKIILGGKRFVIVSYPKSGRTWLRIMLNDLGIYPRFTHSFADFGKPRSWRDKECLEQYFDNRVVLLTRNPKDTVVSSYFQAVGWEGVFEGNLKQFVRDREIGFEAILKFNRAWYERRGEFKSFLHISYEQLHSAPVNAIRRLIKFFGIPGISDRAISAAVSANRFEIMQRREISGELYQKYGNRFSEGGEIQKERLKVREGKVGGYSCHMDDEDLEYCNLLMEKYRYEEAFEGVDAF